MTMILIYLGSQADGCCYILGQGGSSNVLLGIDIQQSDSRRVEGRRGFYGLDLEAVDTILTHIPLSNS